MSIKTVGHSRAETKPKLRPTIIGVGFDGVLHKKTSNERGVEDITGKPIPNAMDFLSQLILLADVVIITERLNCDYTQQQRVFENMQLWFERHIHPVPNLAKSLVSKLTFTAAKPKGMKVFIDNRALSFTGEFPPISNLLKYKSWEEV